MTFCAACGIPDRVASWAMHSGTPPLPAPESFPRIAFLLRARPGAHPEAARILLLLRAEAGPAFLSADALAHQLGLSSRHALARHLRHIGLPPFRELHMWVRVLAMLGEADPAHQALSQLALRRGEDPASWFRLVRRLTGMSWSEVSAKGAPWLVAEAAIAIFGGG